MVSGDVYDRALPPVDAVELADETFARLAASRAQVVVTSGNHDSHVRLGFNARLAAAAGVHLRTRWQDVGTPGAARGRARPGRGPRPALPRARRGPCRLGAGRPAPTRPRSPRRCAGCTPTSTPAPRHPVGGDGARLRRRQPRRRARRWPATASATSPSAACRSRRPACSPASTTPRSATCTAGTRCPRPSATAAPRWPTRSPRPATPRAPGWSSSAATGVERTDFVPAPVPAPARHAARPPRRPARRPGPRRRRGRLAAGHPHRRQAPAEHAMDRLRARFPHTLMLAFDPEGVVRDHGPLLPRVDGRSDYRRRARLRRRGARARGRPPRRRCCCRWPATPAGSTPTDPIPTAGRGRLMRLHQLTVTAFGPFAGTETVDFDELNEAGLFLLTGPTGAGKTSILDAVCFALYGSVPGDARRARRCKSHHADADVAPEVVLDFSMRERRFGRTPHPGVAPAQEDAAPACSPRRRPRPWSRRPRGTDHFLSSRAQEVGHLIGELVGMTSAQFVQVAMLPQGGFQTFLRAGSDERHAVLQQLFRTDRFSRIEEWVNDHSRRLRTQAGDGQSHRAADPRHRRRPRRRRAARGARRRRPARGGRLRGHRALPWLDGPRRRRDARPRQPRAPRASRGPPSTEARAAARRRRAPGRRRADRAAAAAGRARPARGDRRGRDRAARRPGAAPAAAPCLPLLRLLDEAVTRRARGRPSDRDALRAAGPRPRRRPRGAARPGGPARAAAPPRAPAHPSETAAPRRGPRGAASVSTPTATQLDLRRVALPGEVAAAEADGEQAAAAGRTADEAIELAARDRPRPAPGGGRGAAPAARPASRCATPSATPATGCSTPGSGCRTSQDRRLAGIAAELAGRLEDGVPCQVCGSTEHPGPGPAAAPTPSPRPSSRRPATPTTGAPTSSAPRPAPWPRPSARWPCSPRRPAGWPPRRPRPTSPRWAPPCAEAEAASVAAPRGRHQGRRPWRPSSTTSTLAPPSSPSAAATLRQARDTRAEALAVLTDEIAEATEGSPSLTTALADVRARARPGAADRRGHAPRSRPRQQRLAEVRDRADGTASEHGFDDLDAVREAALPDPERTTSGAPGRRAGWPPRPGPVRSSTTPRCRRPRGGRRPTWRRSPPRWPPPRPRPPTRAAPTTPTTPARPRWPRTAPASTRRSTAWAPVRDRVRARRRDVPAGRGAWAATTSCRCGSPPTSSPPASTRWSPPPTSGSAHMRDQRYLLAAHRPGGPQGRPGGPRACEVVDQWTGDDPRPGDAVRRRDVRGVAVAGPRAGRRGHPARPAAPRSTRCSSTRASARSTPTPSTT